MTFIIIGCDWIEMKVIVNLSRKHSSLLLFNLSIFTDASWLITARGNDGSIVFQHHRWVFFICEHDNSWTAALSLMKFCTTCTLTTSRNLLNTKVIGQGHVGFFVCLCVHDRYCLNHLAKIPCLYCRRRFACSTDSVINQSIHVYFRLESIARPIQ